MPAQIKQIVARATQHKKRIVLPEGDDVRVLAAAESVVKQGLAEVIVVGNGDEIKTLAKSEKINLDNVRVVDTKSDENAEKYVEVLLRAHQHKEKEMTREQAAQEIQTPLKFANCMVAGGDADGCVAGAVTTTADVVRAALQIVGKKSSNNKEKTNHDLVSSFFIMQHKLPHQAIQGLAIFADCAMVINPNAEQLARIAIDSTDSAVALLDLKPRVALLSFSTAGSAQHPLVDKVKEAAEIIAQQRPDIALIPEVQFDAAVIPEILQHKAPNIQTQAPANIFIFPDLQSANIGYKIAERIGGAHAVGPVLQGLNHPVNDLSRGCSVEDIVMLVAVTAAQANTA